MKRSRTLYRLVVLFAMLLSLIGGAGTAPAQAEERALPTGLTAADWAQIQALLPPTQQAYLKASNTRANDRFGGSIAISGDTLVVGANAEDSGATGVNGDQADNSAPDSGAVYVFTRSGGIWSQQAYLKASNTGAGFSPAAATPGASRLTSSLPILRQVTTLATQLPSLAIRSWWGRMVKTAMPPV